MARRSPEDFRPKGPQETFGPTAIGPDASRDHSPKCRQQTSGTIVPERLLTQPQSAQTSSGDIWLKGPQKTFRPMVFGPTAFDSIASRRLLAQRSPRRLLGQMQSVQWSPKGLFGYLSLKGRQGPLGQRSPEDFWPNGPQRPLAQRSPGSFSGLAGAAKRGNFGRRWDSNRASLVH